MTPIRERDLPLLAQRLKPYLILPASNGGGAGGTLSAHELNGPYHTGQLAQSQATWATPLTTFNAHVSSTGDPHTQYVLETTTLTAGNGLTGGGDLSANRTFNVAVSGLGLGVGANAVTLTSSSNPGAAASILASDASGFLTLTKLTTPILAAAGNLAVTPVGELNIDAGGDLVTVGSANRMKALNYESQTTGWAIDYNGSGDFRYLYADEMHVRKFIADLQQALAGRQVIAKSVAELAQDFVAPAAGAATFLYVWSLPGADDMDVFEAGDFIVLYNFSRAGGGLNVTGCVGTVRKEVGEPVYADDADGRQYQRWHFTRSSGTIGAGQAPGNMAESTTVQAGSIVLDWGVSGNGGWEVNAIDGVYGINSPYAQVVTWTTNPNSGRAVRTRLGNLRGITGSTEYGLWAGDTVYGNIIVTGDGVKLRQGTTDKITLDSAGASYFSGVMTIGTSGGIYQGSGSFASPTTGLKIWNDSGVGRIAGYNGGTLQAGFNTSGQLTAGAGAVVIDEDGIALKVQGTTWARSAAITALDGSSQVLGDMAFYENAGAGSYGWRIGFDNGLLDQRVEGFASSVAQRVTIYGDDSLYLDVDGYGNQFVFTGGPVEVTGALNVTGAATFDSTVNADRYLGESNTLADTAVWTDPLALGSDAAILVVHLGTDADVALVSARGGSTLAVTIIHAQRSGNFSTTKDTAGDLNMYYESGSLRIQNLRGASRTVTVTRVG